MHKCDDGGGKPRAVEIKDDSSRISKVEPRSKTSSLHNSRSFLFLGGNYGKINNGKTSKLF